MFEIFDAACSVWNTRTWNKKCPQQTASDLLGFCQFRTQITGNENCASKLFVIPVKNGTRLRFQNIFLLSLSRRKNANYLISLCSHFARKSLRVKVKRPKDSWFPWKMGQDCAFRIFFDFHSGGQTWDYCFYGHRAKRTSTLMWNVS